MRKKYIQHKYIQFKKFISKQLIFKVIFIVIGLNTIFFMIALMSFTSSDPSWSQTTWNTTIKNLGGNVGSWSADILFSAFGIVAFSIPPLLLFGYWIIYYHVNQRNYIDFFSLSSHLIGSLSLILSSCGLAEIHFNDLPHFSSGGVIGSIFSNLILRWCNSFNATLTLLLLLLIGFTLLTGLSWLTISEKIAAIISFPINLTRNRSNRNNISQYDVKKTEHMLKKSQKSEHQTNNKMYFNKEDS
ncbi:DNA translocase FtsK 4TM domain-containing protein [Candidatus Hartigia pinicola]